MQLTVDLGDREEIGAALALLERIYTETEPAAPDVGTFGKLGSAPSPLYPPAPAAPSIAGAALPPIAPEAPPATSTQLPSAPIPPAPPAAPTAAVPTAPAAPTSPAAPVELDAAGMPWDERIHASTKTKTDKGVWKAKRGINDPALVKRVEAELLARVLASSAPGASMAQMTEGVPQAPAMDAAAVFGGAPVAPSPAPGVPTAPAPFVPPAASSAPVPPAAPSVDADPTTFEQLMTRISPLVVAGKLPPTALGQACASNGIASPADLPKAVQFVPLVWTTLKQINPTAFV